MRRYLPVLLLVLLLAGCGSGRNQPAVVPQAEAPAPSPPQAPSPAKPEGPRLVARWYYRESPGQQALVPGITQIQLNPGQAEAVVGSGEVNFTWVLDQELVDLKERIRWTGYAPDKLNSVEKVAQAHFPAGGPERWEVWLEGVEGSRATLVRRPEPNVTIGYRHRGGELVGVEGHELSLPAGSLVLEFRFDQPMAPGSAEAWAGFAGERAWREPSLLVWSMEQVPAKLALDMGRLQAAGTGLPVNPRPLVVRNSETGVYLERWNLATGVKERVLDLVPEISEAHLSPDGRWLALRFWEKKGTEWRHEGVAVADLQGRKLIPVAMKATELRWAGTKLLNFGYRWVEEAGWESWDPEAGGKPVFHPEKLNMTIPSPDGRLVAGLRGSAEGAASGPGWLSLWLTDLATGQRREVPDFVRGWVWAKGGDWSQWTAWSPDGKRVAALDPVKQVGEVDLVVYDLTTGQRQVVRKGLELTTWGHYLRWSPDGTKILTDGYDKGVIPLDGGPVVKLEESWQGSYWDHRGERILAATGAWSEVFVYHLKDGSRTSLGPGMPVGWDGEWAYVIRWPGSDGRHVDMGP
ncbi:MAG: TolB family protein [Bacillota bacterium]